MEEESPVEAPPPWATPKQRLLYELFKKMEESVTLYAVLVLGGMEAKKALWSTGLTRTLKHILSNIDMRSYLGNQINVISMQKLIAYGRGNPEFTQSLSQGLTHRELQRLLRLVLHVEPLLEKQESSVSITPSSIPVVSSVEVPEPKDAFE